MNNKRLSYFSRSVEPSMLNVEFPRTEIFFSFLIELPSFNPGFALYETTLKTAVFVVLTASLARPG